MQFEKVTEMPSRYHHLEQMETMDILANINNEDKTVPLVIEQILPKIAQLVDMAKEKILAGGRLFYLGAGTSGRLGVLDASECPPTYGVPPNMVTGVMAGGEAALRYGIEDIEDSEEQGWVDLQQYEICKKDVVVGIAASGTTTYVIGGLKEARKRGIVTGCVVCNTNSPVARFADYPNLKAFMKPAS